MPDSIPYILKELKARFRGRTRYEGKEPKWDEIMVGEIERLQEAVKELRMPLEIFVAEFERMEKGEAPQADLPSLIKKSREVLAKETVDA